MKYNIEECRTIDKLTKQVNDRIRLLGGHRLFYTIGGGTDDVTIYTTDIVRLTQRELKTGVGTEYVLKFLDKKLRSNIIK